jgi:site-specific DNA-methyltransferase (adenine-specific)
MKINKIYNLDCFKFLSKFDEEYIDLAIIDPPYNMGKDSWDKFKTNKDFFDFTFAWIDAIIPKLKKTASIYIFNTPYNSAYILQHLIAKGLIFQNWITWDKRDGINASKKRYTHGQETILFFTKSSKYTFNYENIRVPYESTDRIKHAFKKGLLKNGKRWFPNPNGRLCGEVWHFSSERHKDKINGKLQKLNHPTPKPLDLIERIIEASSNENDIIVDCFVGSGTTAIAAKKLGRNFICSDLNKTFVELSKNKLLNYDNKNISFK